MIRRTFLILFLVFIPLAADAAVLINEIAWMGTSVSTADEWIELKNDSGSEVDVSGWRLEWRGGEYGITLDQAKCSNTVLQAGGYFLFERTNDDTLPSISADCIYTGALSNNPGEHLVLKDTSLVISDSVDATSGWPAGDNSTKDTMQKSGSGWITASPTPRAVNSGASSNPPSPTPLPPPSSPPASQSALAQEAGDTPSIKAYAGEDRPSVTGSATEFLGSATGLKGEPFVSARFFWNFGDGETKEGRAVSHIFRIPGKYTVGLHVSSGEYASSDYMIVDVAPNQVTISGVLLGEEGYVKLINLTNFEVDIGGWTLEDSSGNRFGVPSRSKISAKTEIAFANAVTGLLKTNLGLPLILRYPNFSVAGEWKGIPEVLGAKIAASGPIITKEIVPAENKNANAPVYRETIEESKDSTLESKSTKELASSIKSNRSSLFFAASSIFGIVAALGFLFLKRIFVP